MCKTSRYDVIRSWLKASEEIREFQHAVMRLKALSLARANPNIR